ncbi:hypothetical protein V499_09557 [Pseudogymnoascus sp. VKM F-103]|nr:hypothetical protein V499_09557 [Pseudogymnoascus sp. VKM F-103]
MKLSVLSAVLLPVLIHAQAIPDCATACLSSAIVAASCTPGDNACACTPAKQAEIGTAGAPCLITSCSAEEIPAVIAAGSAACSSYFATQSGSATATTGSTASDSKNSESTAAPTITSDRSTSAETTSTETTSVPSTSGDSSDTTTSSDVSTTDGPAATTTGGGGAQGPSSSTGGAAAMATAFGGVAMALLGVAVAL